jgi:hypothetical protein
MNEDEFLSESDEVEDPITEALVARFLAGGIRAPETILSTSLDAVRAPRADERSGASLAVIEAASWPVASAPASTWRRPVMIVVATFSTVALAAVVHQTWRLFQVEPAHSVSAPSSSLASSRGPQQSAPGAPRSDSITPSPASGETLQERSPQSSFVSVGQPVNRESVTAPLVVAERLVSNSPDRGEPPSAPAGEPADNPAPITVVGSVDSPVTPPDQTAASSVSGVASVTGATSVARTSVQTDAIQRALARYQAAFSRLDVEGVRRVWPGVDRDNLVKAFAQVREESLTFEACAIDVSGATAVASCGGTTSYVPRVGNRGVRVERQQWRISLRESAQDWVVESVEVRPR